MQFKDILSSSISHIVQIHFSSDWKRLTYKSTATGHRKQIKEDSEEKEESCEEAKARQWSSSPTSHRLQ